MTAIATEPRHHVFDADAPVAPYDDARLLDATAAAELLSVPVSWVREHSRNGHLPHVQLGRYIRYRRSALLAYVESQESGGAAWRKHRPRTEASA